jgi:hypothetical protein
VSWAPPCACDACDACDAECYKQLSPNQLRDERLRRQCDADATRLEVHATRSDRDWGLGEWVGRTSASLSWADRICWPASMAGGHIGEWTNLSARVRYAGRQHGRSIGLENCDAFAGTSRRSDTTRSRPAAGLSRPRGTAHLRPAAWRVGPPRADDASERGAGLDNARRGCRPVRHAGRPPSLGNRQPGEIGRAKSDLPSGPTGVTATGKRSLSSPQRSAS